jgi:hypothetical protein
MIEIARAILLLLLVAASLSGTFSLIFDWTLPKFMIGAAIAVVLQLAIKWYIDKHHETTVEEIIETLPMPSIKMQIECAFCKTKNVIDYNLLQEEFECEHCKNVNAIYGKFYAARKVMPLDAVLTPDIPEVI